MERPFFGAGAGAGSGFVKTPKQEPRRLETYSVSDSTSVEEDVIDQLLLDETRKLRDGVELGDEMAEICKEDAMALFNATREPAFVTDLSDAVDVGIERVDIERLCNHWVAIPPRRNAISKGSTFWGSTPSAIRGVENPSESEIEMMNNWAASGGVSVIASAVNLYTGHVVVACFPRVIKRVSEKMELLFQGGSKDTLDMIWSESGTEIMADIASTLADEIQVSAGSTLLTKQLARLTETGTISRERLHQLYETHNITTKTFGEVADDRVSIPVFNTEFDALFSQLFTLIRVIEQQEPESRVFLSRYGSGTETGAEATDTETDTYPDTDTVLRSPRSINSIKAFIRQVQLFYRSPVYKTYHRVVIGQFPTASQSRGIPSKEVIHRQLKEIATPYFEGRFSKKELEFVVKWRKSVYAVMNAPPHFTAAEAEAAAAAATATDTARGRGHRKYQASVVAEAKLWLGQMVLRDVPMADTIATAKSELGRIVSCIQSNREAFSDAATLSQFNTFCAEIHALITKTAKKINIVKESMGTEPVLDIRAALWAPMEALRIQARKQGYVKPLVFTRDVEDIASIVFDTIADNCSGTLSDDTPVAVLVERKRGVLGGHTVTRCLRMKDEWTRELKAEISAGMWSDVLATPHASDAAPECLLLLFPSSMFLGAVLRDYNYATTGRRSDRARDAVTNLMSTSVLARMEGIRPAPRAGIPSPKKSVVVHEPSGAPTPILPSQFFVWTCPDDVMPQLRWKAKEYGMPVDRILERMWGVTKTFSVSIIQKSSFTIVPEREETFAVALDLETSGFVLTLANGEEYLVVSQLQSTKNGVYVSGTIRGTLTRADPAINMPEMAMLLANELLARQKPPKNERVRMSGTISVAIASFLPS